MIIKDSEQMRRLTGSFYANADFSKIETIVRGVEDELAQVIGRDVMASLAQEAEGEEATMKIETADGQTLRVANREFNIGQDGTIRLGEGYSAYGITARLEGDTLHLANASAVVSCQQAVAYMAAMRYYRLNDISHETMGRKVKIDHDNEARPFEWQLARDDRMHLEEYYRALDRLTGALASDPRYWQTGSYRRQAGLIVRSAEMLTWLTGADESPWLYLRLVPHLAESQRFVEQAYGSKFDAGSIEAPYPSTDTLDYAASKAVALGAIALMGRRTSLQALPYGLMRLFESDGGGNRQEQGTMERIGDYLKQLSRDQHYWLEEMKRLRDAAAGLETTTHLQMPENDRHNKYMRL